MHGLNRTLTFLLMAGAVAVFAQTARAETCLVPAAPPDMIEGETLDGGAVADFYAAAGGECAWSVADAAILVRALDALADQAIDPAPFHRDAIRRAAPAERDLLLTDAALRYARTMTSGQLAPGDVDADWDFPLASVDSVAALRASLETHTVGDWLATLPPAEPAYRALIATLARYRALALVGGWQQVPAGPPLHAGQSDPRLAALRNRLRVEGDLAAPAADASNRFDAETVAALKRFQLRHGMTPDGVLGQTSLLALNVPIEARIDQIAANLERWRWMAHAIPDTRVEVNIAAQRLELVSDGELRMEMRTVVGDPQHWTPLLIAPASSLLLNPSWKVPTSIITKEIRPKLRRQPDYLERNDMQWIGNQLVQAPGPKNSLGQIKLELRDRFDIYLHDTPMRSLFARDRRALSHGCVRLEYALDLATELLSSRPGWAREEIEASIATGATTRIQLPRTISVVLSYWTVELAPDGMLVFRDDIYGRDLRLATRLGHGWMALPQTEMGRKDTSPGEG